MLGGVVTVGIASLADRGGSGGGNEAVVPNPCPALDKSDGPKTLFTARPVYCLVSGVAYTAVFDTSEGEIRFTLDRARMPETTNNFVALARYGYYDNTLLFRIDPSIGIIQGGSPTTNDWSDPGPGYTIPDEGGAFHRLANEGVSGPFSYESGQLVMARSAGLNSSGAQFFLTTTESVSLLDSQGSYLLFGATDNAGQSVLDAMMDLYVVDPESPYGGGPSHEIVVHSVTIVEG
jgi:cyclophilin family peptidyl-prolyl cis-trans isomerase